MDGPSDASIGCVCLLMAYVVYQGTPIKLSVKLWMIAFSIEIMQPLR